MTFYQFLLLTGLAILAIATVEALYRGFWRREAYDWRSYWASFADMIGRRLLALLTGGATVAIFGAVWQHRLFTIPLDSWWAWALLFVGQEFCYYWMHRADHEIRWFWATHAVHHSPNELNFAAAYRLGWTATLSGQALFFIPLVYIGFRPEAVAGALALNLLYQFWVHADWIPKLGALERVLNTPSHHRVHHASNPEYLDANYGGVLIVFDRLFGSFVEERTDLPCRFGLVKPLTSYNPVYIAFHEWLAMARDVWTAPTWHARLMHVVGRPGWRPDGRGLTTADLRRQVAEPLPARS
jgi:sterol desaturase/sphingolipid hydroxylase (fatty acid hydroxylase superfamily)